MVRKVVDIEHLYSCTMLIHNSSEWSKAVVEGWSLVKIAVIGATGMIGNHVLQAGARRGHDMIAISRRPLSGAALHLEGVEARTADLAHVPELRRAIEGADAVVHCAGYYPAAPRPVHLELAEATKLSNNFYEACVGLGLQRIVYVGAAIAVPRTSGGMASDGQASFTKEPSSSNSYLQVKWLQDSIARKHAADGLPVVIGVPAMTFGEFDPGNTTGNFILGVAKKTFRAFVDGKRNVVYAGDAADGLILAAERGITGHRYLFTGENLTMEQLMGKIARITQAPMPKTIPLPLTKALYAFQLLRYKFLSGPVPTISETALAVMSSGQFLDGRVAASELGYKPSVSVDEAIERALAWFVKAGALPARGEG